MNAHDFIRIGNNILNVAHVVRVEYQPEVKPISGFEDSRVVSHEYHWSDRISAWVDRNGGTENPHPVRTLVTVTATELERDYEFSSSAATSIIVTAYGHEADAVMRWFAQFAAVPVTDEREAKL